MLRPKQQGKRIRIEADLSAEDYATLQLALHDLSMELLSAPDPSDAGKAGLHYLLALFRPCLEREVDASVGH